MVQAEHHRDLKQALLQLPTWTVQQLNQLLSSNRFRLPDATCHRSSPGLIHRFALCTFRRVLVQDADADVLNKLSQLEPFEQSDLLEKLWDDKVYREALFEALRSEVEHKLSEEQNQKPMSALAFDADDVDGDAGSEAKESAGRRGRGNQNEHILQKLFDNGICTRHDIEQQMIDQFYKLEPQYAGMVATRVSEELGGDDAHPSTVFGYALSKARMAQREKKKEEVEQRMERKRARRQRRQRQQPEQTAATTAEGSAAQAAPAASDLHSAPEEQRGEGSAQQREDVKDSAHRRAEKLREDHKRAAAAVVDEGEGQASEAEPMEIESD